MNTHRRFIAAATASLLVISLLSAAFVACDDTTGTPGEVDAADITTDGPTELGPDVVVPRFSVTAMEAVENPTNSLSYYVSWRTSAPVPSGLAVDCGPEYQRVIGPGRRFSQDHEVFVMGLWTGAECTFTVTGERDGDAGAIDVSVGGPGVRLPPLDIRVRDAARLAPGWTLVNLNAEIDELPLRVVLVDDLGRPRWYHTHWTAYGSDTNVEVTPEGVLVGGWSVTRPSLVSWQGLATWEGPFANHHDITYDPQERVFWYLGHYNACPPELSGDGNGYLRESSVNRWDFDRGERTYTWAICEHYTPPEVWVDWSHMNTVVLRDDGRLLLSSRNQNALLLVDPSTDELVWTLGAGDDFTFVDREGAPDPRFLGQHDPEPVTGPNGESHILLFDNGRGRGFSRAVEIGYDEAAGEVWGAWEWRPEPDIFAPVYGDADRLENGNTLVVFGLRSETEHSQLFEVTADGEVVWQAALPLRWGMYRAERVSVPPAGFVLR